MVLLVDDQILIGEAVRRLLADEPNIDFHFCSDPLQAIAIAKHIAPTVILQDLAMPDADGLSLVREYRSHPVTRAIPVIVLSTKEEAKTKSEAFAAGANDYLVKLPDKIELIARLQYHSRAYRNPIAAVDNFKQYNDTYGHLSGDEVLKCIAAADRVICT